MAGAAVEIRRVERAFGAVSAVRSFDLVIEDGAFVTLLGPSGCGKTTTLRMIAGLEQPTGGEILIKGRRVDDLPIHHRNIGIVFQNLALFPHKTVAENVAYGLKFRPMNRADRGLRVKAALAMVRLPDHGDRLPSQLSGGQQQRVALARATVIQPDVLLLDEPLSALDAALRQEMRVELKRIQRELGVTTLFVTHDQAEALALSDKVVVMNKGAKEQEGTPFEVYGHPATRFVAEFLGSSNILSGVGTRDCPGHLLLADGTVLAVPPGMAAPGLESCVAVRAERLEIGTALEPSPQTTLFDGVVAFVDYQGSIVRYVIATSGPQLEVIGLLNSPPIPDGTRVQVRIRAVDCIPIGTS